MMRGRVDVCAVIQRESSEKSQNSRGHRRSILAKRRGSWRHLTSFAKEVKIGLHVSPVYEIRLGSLRCVVDFRVSLRTTSLNRTSDTLVFAPTYNERVTVGHYWMPFWSCAMTASCSFSIIVLSMERPYVCQHAAIEPRLRLITHPGKFGVESAPGSNKLKDSVSDIFAAGPWGRPGRSRTRSGDGEGWKSQSCRRSSAAIDTPSINRGVSRIPLF